MSAPIRFSEAVSEQMKLTGMSNEMLGAHVGVSRSTIHNWRRDNGWPMDMVCKVALAVGLGEHSIEYFRERYAFGGWPSSRRRKGQAQEAKVAGGHAARVSGDQTTRIRAARLQAAQHIRLIEDTTADMLSNLDFHHFFISTTTAIRNYAWYSDEELAKEREQGRDIDLIPGRVSGIKNGALFLSLVPNEKCFGRYRRHVHGEAKIDSYSEIVDGIDTFKRRAVREIRSVGPTLTENDASILFASGQRFLTVTEMPFTGAGWTVSLLGTVISGDRVRKQALIHGPYSTGLSLQLWDEEDHFFPNWLFGWMEKIVAVEARKEPRSADGTDGFYRTLLRRMQGRASRPLKS